MKLTIAIAVASGLGGLGLGLLSRGFLPDAEVAADSTASTAAGAAAPTLSSDALEAGGSALTSAEAAAPRTGSTRVDAAEALAAAESEVEAETLALDLEQPDLFAELTALLTSGRIEAFFAAGQGDAKGFLFSRYLELGDADAAWSLLATHGADQSQWSRLGNALQSQNRHAEAVGAWSQAVDLLIAESNEGNLRGWQRREIPNLINRIGQIDAGAAAQIAERFYSAEEGDNGLALAQHLINAGRDGEARALIDPLLDHPVDRLEALRILADLDPDAAEEILSEAFATDGDPMLGAQLANLLVEEGRPEEAVALVDEMLASADPAVPGMLSEVLGSLPPEHVVEHMDGWIDQADLTLADDASVELLTEAIGIYVETGRSERAVEIQVRLLDSLADGNTAMGWLPQMDEEAARAHADMLEPALRNAERGARGNDEVWGDLADNYWMIGRFEDARRCWERARAIDPGDGEWSGKLRAVHDGTDPL